MFMRSEDIIIATAFWRIGRIGVVEVDGIWRPQVLMASTNEVTLNFLSSGFGIIMICLVP